MSRRSLLPFIALATILLALWFALGPSRSSAPSPPELEEPADRREAPDAPVAAPPPAPPARSPAAVEPSAPASTPVSAQASAPATGTMTLRGSVRVWGETTPIEGARIRGFFGGDDPPFAETQTAADGSFVLTKVFPLSSVSLFLRVWAAKDGFVDGIHSRCYHMVPKLPADRWVIPLFLHHSVTVQGRVAEVFTDLPIEGARVSQVWREFPYLGIRADGGFEERSEVFPRAVTDAEGRFTAVVPKLRAGVSLQADADGYLPGSGEAKPEEDQRGIEVRLAKEDQLPRVEGRVFDLDGSPAEGAIVKADWANQARMKEALLGPVREAGERYAEVLSTRRRRLETRTDASGRFAMTLPWAATWTFTARIGSASLASQTIEVTEARRYECEIRFSGDEVAFVGEVRSRATGRPVSGAMIFASPAPPRRGEGSNLSSGEDGRFRLGPVPRGPYRFEVHARGFVRTEVRADPLEASETPVVVEMEEECRVRGVVVDEGGNPVQGVQVMATASDAHRTRGASTDRTGAFVVHELSAGHEYVVSAVRNQPPPLSSGTVLVQFAATGEERDVGPLLVRPRP